jgi:hypothetical protein
MNIRWGIEDRMLDPDRELLRARLQAAVAKKFPGATLDGDIYKAMEAQSRGNNYHFTDLNGRPYTLTTRELDQLAPRQQFLGQNSQGTSSGFTQTVPRQDVPPRLPIAQNLSEITGLAFSEALVLDPNTSRPVRVMQTTLTREQAENIRNLAKNHPDIANQLFGKDVKVTIDPQLPILQIDTASLTPQAMHSLNFRSPSIKAALDGKSPAGIPQTFSWGNEDRRLDPEREAFRARFSEAAAKKFPGTLHFQLDIQDSLAAYQRGDSITFVGSDGKQHTLTSRELDQLAPPARGGGMEQQIQDVTSGLRNPIICSSGSPSSAGVPVCSNPARIAR